MRLFRRRRRAARKRAPKAGIVYFIGPKDKRLGELVKIGWTGRTAEARLEDFQTGSPVELHIIAEMQGPQGFERHLHRVFRAENSRREWFQFRSPWIERVQGEMARVGLRSSALTVHGSSPLRSLAGEVRQISRADRHSALLRRWPVIR